MNEEANFTIGNYLLTKERERWLSPSVSYTQQSMGLAYKERYRHVSPFSQFVAPFSLTVWLLIFAVLCMSAIIILLLKKLSSRQRHFIIGGRMNRSPILNMINLFLGGLVDNRRRRHLRYFGTFARTLAMLWMLFSFFLRKSFEGTLFGFLQNQPIDLPCDTVEEVKTFKCQIVMWKSSIGALSQYVNDESRYTFCNDLVQDCIRKMINDDIHGDVIYINELTTQYFNYMNAPQQLGYTKDRIFTVPAVFLFKKYSRLQIPFNHLIRMYEKFGLIAHWSRQYTDNFKRKFKHERGIPPKLKLHNVQAVFEICGYLYVFSLFIFLLEILSLRFKFLKRIIEYLTY